MKNHQKFQIGNVLTISVIHSIHDIYSSFLAPLLPLLIEKLNLSYALVGVLTVIQRIPSLLNPVVGMIADRLAVRYFIISAPAITAISMSLLGVASHYTVLAILLFIMGIGSALFHVPGPVMIKQVSGNRVGKGLSFYMLGGEIARTLGPLTVLGAISLWGLAGTYKLIPFGILASVVIYFKFKNIPLQPGRKPAESITGLSNPSRKLIRFFIILAGINFFRGIIRSALTTFLPTYLTVTGASLWLAGISLSIFQFAGAIGTFWAGSLSDKIGRKQTLLIITITTPILLGLFIFSEGVWRILILVLLGFFVLAYGPVLLAVVQDVDSHRPAFVNGIYMTISFLMASVTSVLIGALGDWVGLVNCYKLIAAIGLGGIFFVLWLPGRRPE